MSLLLLFGGTVTADDTDGNKTPAIIAYPRARWTPAAKRQHARPPQPTLYLETEHATTGDGNETFVRSMRSGSRAYDRPQMIALDLHVDAAAPTEDEAQFLRFPQPKRPVFRRAVPQPFDPETLHATTDDGVPVTYPGRSRKPPRGRLPAQPQSLDWTTLHATTDDGAPILAPNRQRWVFRDVRAIASFDLHYDAAVDPDDGSPIALVMRARRGPRTVRLQTISDLTTLHATTDDGSPILASARAWQRRRVRLPATGFDLEVTAAVTVDEVVIAQVLRRWRTIRNLRTVQPFELGAEDFDAPIARAGRSRRPAWRARPSGLVAPEPFEDFEVFTQGFTPARMRAWRLRGLVPRIVYITDDNDVVVAVTVIFATVAGSDVAGFATVEGNEQWTVPGSHDAWFATVEGNQQSTVAGSHDATIATVRGE